MSDKLLNPKRRIIDPKKAMVMFPSFDGKVEVGFMGGMLQCVAQGLVGGFHGMIGNSSISGVRGKIANAFLASPFEWLICIDTDIQFVLRDMQLLLSVEEDYNHGGKEFAYTRTEAGEELAVTAEYSKKDDQMQPVRFGMGFVRLHRSVFEKLNDLRASDTGEELLGRYYEDGKMCVDYYPEMVSHDGRKLHEDTSFWTFVQLAGIIPRIETRTRLVHWGKKAYPYGVSLGG